jgi:hypothetical protein
MRLQTVLQEFKTMWRPTIDAKRIEQDQTPLLSMTQPSLRTSVRRFASV